MRIFTAVRHSIDPSFYYGGLWSGNFYPALSQLGHEIIESQVDLLSTSRFMHVASNFTAQELEVRTRTTEQILEEVRTAHRQETVDLFLSYFYNSHFDPLGFDELRRLGIPSVNFYCNSIYQFENVSEIAAKADYSWYPEKNAHDLYVQVGGRPVWVQMAADPDVYHPLPEIQRKSRSCFVGQRYADRDRWMAALLKEGVPVDIFGSGWGALEIKGTDSISESTEYLGRPQDAPASTASYRAALSGMIAKQGLVGGLTRAIRQYRYRAETRRLAAYFPPFAKGSIPFQQITEVFAAHEVCLNFSNVWADGRPGSKLIPHVRLRDFEAPMCRTCYLTGHTDEIEDFYEIGREIDTYRSVVELIDKTRFYLSNRDAAERIRSAGYARARRDHTWVRRFEELFGKIGLRTRVSQT